MLSRMDLKYIELQADKYLTQEHKHIWDYSLSSYVPRSGNGV